MKSSREKAGEKDMGGSSTITLPIDQGVGLGKSWKSKDDVLLSAVHYMKKNLVEDSGSLNIESDGEADVTFFV